MFTEELATVAGTHHSVAAAYNNPKPIRGDIPILIGGSGEKKTLRFVARYADGCNLFGDAERARHLLGVLAGHCETEGRDPAEITKTAMMTVLIAETQSEVDAKLGVLRAAGVAEERIATMNAGTPEQVLERAAAYKAAGIEGIHALDAGRARPRSGRPGGPHARAAVHRLKRPRAGATSRRAPRNAPAAAGHPRPADDERVEQMVAPVGAAATQGAADRELGEHAGLGHRVVRVQGGEGPEVGAPGVDPVPAMSSSQCLSRASLNRR
jgi:hypothetical protein